ncbi:MAG: hypothetical protein WCK21_08120 [Actinomycetota bacterium]
MTAHRTFGNRPARLLAAGLTVLAFGTLTSACFGSDRGSGVGGAESSPIGPADAATYEYKVPFGTGNKLDSGETIAIMPQTLDVKVGESIRIVNDDIRDYMIGPFFVASGQTLAMRFTHKGTIKGVCQINPEGEFIINVTV